MIERDTASVVVQDVEINCAVEEVCADEAEIAIDGRSGAAQEGVGAGGVVGEEGVGVLEVGYYYCKPERRIVSITVSRRMEDWIQELAAHEIMREGKSEDPQIQ